MIVYAAAHLADLRGPEPIDATWGIEDLQPIGPDRARLRLRCPGARCQKQYVISLAYLSRLIVPAARAGRRAVRIGRDRPALSMVPNWVGPAADLIVAEALAQNVASEDDPGSPAGEGTDPT